MNPGSFPGCTPSHGWPVQSLGPIGGGTARLARWCLEDLERPGRNQEVLIVPVACQYLYHHEPEKLFDRLVRRILRQRGLQAPSTESRREVLLEPTAGLLEKMEAFYDQFYTSGVDGRISALDRMLADRVADETYLHLRHNELVDVLEYLHPEYIDPQASLNRLIEYALTLAEVINRLMGGDLGFCSSPPNKSVQINIGEPIKVRELFPLIPGNRRQRAEGLMKVLVSRLEHLSGER